MNVGAQLRVDGVWLASCGLPYSDLAWTDRADGGNFECTWDMENPFGGRAAPVFKGAKVEVYLGLARRWYGEVTETDWDGGQFTATGMSQRAYDFAARTAGGLKSSVPDTIIDTSIASDGWRITRPQTFSAAAAAVDATNILSVGNVLDQSTEDFGTRWGVWGDGIIRAYYPPTVYDYILAPGVVELGETTEETFTRVIYQYLDSTTNLVTLGGYGSTESPVRHTFQDYTSKGPIAAGLAATFAQNQINLGLSAPGWTTSVEVASSQILTPGGLPADLASVTAGQMVRALVVGEQGQSSYRDLAIGETKYAAGADVLTLSPVGKVATNLSDIVEDTYARLTGTTPAAS